jgi:hypothetical protein
MQENAAAGGALKGPVGAREESAARQEPRPSEGGCCPGPPSTSAVRMLWFALLSGDQCTEWVRGEQACGALWLCVGRGWPGRNARATVVGVALTEYGMGEGRAGVRCVVALCG